MTQPNFAPASPWMLVFINSNWLQCGGLTKKQVYGKKKITPMSSINNCAIVVGLLPHVLLSFQHCSLLPHINLIHDCALLRRSVWPARSIHLMRQKTSRLNKEITGWTNIYKKKWKEKWEEANNLAFAAPRWIKSAFRETFKHSELMLCILDFGKKRPLTFRNLASHI